MSETVLFCFGGVVFFIVLSGAFLFGLSFAKKAFDRDI